jgi:Na+-driven multidrug efflux pump
VGGAPNFSRQSITSIASIILNSIASGYGEALVAAFTVATRIISLGNMLMIGFGQGFQPICAMNYGAGKFDRVKKALNITVIIGSVFLLISTILIAVYAVPLSALLSSNEDVIMLSAKIVRFQCLSLPVMAVFALSSMFLQNVGRYFPALFISVSRQGFVFLPLLFILNTAYGEFGLYILQPVADIISTAFSVVLVYVFWNKVFPNEKKRNLKAITKSYGKR